MKYQQRPSTSGRDITVAVITGSRPPDVCGVGDYTERLCSALSAIDVNAQLVHIARPAFSDVPSILRTIADIDADLVHIQYPTMGYGRSLVPYLLSLPLFRIPRIVTLHEYSIFKFYRKPAFAAFALGAEARIFSNAREVSAFSRHYPLRKGSDFVIRIGSNIPVAQVAASRSNEIVYFGQIMPNKGLESFFDLVRLANAARENLRFVLVGAIPEKFQTYGRQICAEAGTLGIRVALNLSRDEVANRLATALFAYLPFPDGASPKRGSMIAALLNGAVVLSSHTANTPDWLREATVHVAGPGDALSIIRQLSSDERERSRLVSAGRHLDERFSWQAIAAAHRSLYLSVLRDRAPLKTLCAAAPPSGQPSQTTTV
jgi:glycosyltransferase involved in cell wall biosynthesis